MPTPDFDAWEREYQNRTVLEPKPIQQPDFDAWEQEYQAKRRGTSTSVKPDFDAWEREYQTSHPLSENNARPAFQDYADTRGAESVGEPRPGDTSGKDLQDKITEGLKDIGATGAYLVSSALQGAVHPLFAPLEGTAFDTNKAIARAVDYWRKHTPKGFTVHDLGVTVSKKPVDEEIANIGPVRLVPTQYSARDLAGQVAEGAGFMVPASKALEAGQLVSRATGLSGASAKIAGGAVGGALLGEGKPKQTLENAAMFGLFEAVPALGNVVKNKAQRVRLMREWKKLPLEQRVPVVQSLDEALQKNPNMTEADAVRVSQQWFKEAQKSRITGMASARSADKTTAPGKTVTKQPTTEKTDIWGPDEEWISPTPQPVPKFSADFPTSPVSSGATAPKQLLPPTPKFPNKQKISLPVDKWEAEFQKKKKSVGMPTVDELVSANTDEERRKLLAQVFDLTPEEMAAIDDDQFVELTDPVKDALTMDYMADLEYAMRTRNKDDVQELLRRIKNKEYGSEGAPDGHELTTVQVEQKTSSKTAPDVSETLVTQKEKILAELDAAEQRLKAGDDSSYFTINLGDGTAFKIRATTESIEAFRKRVKRGLSPVVRKTYKPTSPPLRRKEMRIGGENIIAYKQVFTPTRKKRFTRKLFGDTVVIGKDFIGNGSFVVDKVTGKKLLPGIRGLEQQRLDEVIDNIVKDKLVEGTLKYVVKTPDMQRPLVVIEANGRLYGYFSEVFDRVYAATKPDTVLVGKDNGIAVFKKKDKTVAVVGPTSLDDATIKKYLDDYAKQSTTAEPEQAYKDTQETGQPVEKQIMELPEVIELTRRFIEKDPRIVKAFADFGVRGQFDPNTNTIKLRRDLAENPELAARVLAHELGHAEDFSMDTLARGNILGRIAKLRRYLLHQLAEKPGAPGPLTEEEKAALREEARKIRQQEIDQALGAETGFSPEEILNFLRGVDTTKLPKSVRDYIAKAPTPVKKSIVKQAMKGLSPEELRHLRREPRGVGKPIEEHFRELLKKEVERRKLWELEEIKEELRTFSKQWRPWEEGQDKDYDEYRNKPEELYADAVSGLILAPDKLKSVAPKFYQAFENYLETRPKFAENWQAIMDRINAGPEAISRHRVQQSYDEFARQEELAREREKTRIQQRKAEEEKTVDTFLRGLNTTDHPILKFVRRAEKTDALTKRKAAVVRELLLKRPYTPSEIDAYSYDFKQWYDKVKKSKVTLDELGALGKRLHIVYNRKGIFSAGGLTPKTAAKDIAVLARDWGPEKYNEARKLLDEYRTLREKFILPLLRKSGLVSPKLAKTMQERKFYLRVLSQDWLRADQWPGMKQFYRQVGTISGQQNPITATFLDDIASIYAARENMVRRSVYRFLAEVGAGRKAVMKYSPTEKRMVVDKRAMRHREKLARVKVNGRNQYYFMLDNVVDALEKDSYKQYQVLRLWQTIGQIFRELYVGSNPQWMLRNMPRDFLETVFKNPDVVGVKGIAKLLKAYWDTAPDVWKEAWKNERSALIQDMMRRRTLPTNRLWGSFEETPANEIERTLARYNLYKLTPSQKKLYQKFIRKFFEGQTPEQIANTIEKFAREVWDRKERVGRGSDLWGKVAARRFFEKYTDLPQHEIDRRVIEQAGTPNYKNKGAWQIITNNFFMFSTVAKEGLKAELRAAMKSPVKWLMAVTALTVLPAIMNQMADEGAMGKYIKRIMNRIPKYYKDHYFVIPLFVDENGKANFLAFPTGYNQQVLKAIIAKATRGEFGAPSGAAAEATGFSPYSIHPLIGKLTNFALYYLYGINPPNLHYGTNVIAPADYEVGGKAAAKDLFRDAWNSLTGGWLYRAKGPYESQRKSKLEKSLSTFPGNILGTFYKISDAGIGERIHDKLDAMRKEAKRKNLTVREYRLQLAKDRDAAIAAAQVMRHAGDRRQAKELLKDVARLWGDQWAKAIATARNDEEREAIVQMMLEDNE